MLFEVLRLVGMKHGTGIGTGTRTGYGVGVEYMATGVGVYIGTGHGSNILFGSQFSSTNNKMHSTLATSFHDCCRYHILAYTDPVPRSASANG